MDLDEAYESELLGEKFREKGEHEKAFKLFKEAAEYGLDSSQVYLGICYYNSEGVEEDLNKAYYWFKKAEEKGNEVAKEMIQEMERQGTIPNS